MRGERDGNRSPFQSYLHNGIVWANWYTISLTEPGSGYKCKDRIPVNLFMPFQGYYFSCLNLGLVWYKHLIMFVSKFGDATLSGSEEVWTLGASSSNDTADLPQECLH